MQMDWDPELIISGLRDTTHDPDEISHFVDRQRERMKALTQNGTLNLKQAIQLLLSMKIYATWLSITGLVKIADDDESGWSSIHGAFLYRSIATRVSFTQLDKTKKGQLQLRDGIAECLAHAIAIGDESFADLCGRRLIASLHNKDNRFVHNHGTPYEPFIVALYGKWRSLPWATQGEQSWALGGYQQLLDGWEDSSVFNLATKAACDYHCTNDGYLNYANVPYFLIPVEILGINRVRKDLGQPEFAGDHPLMQSKFAGLSPLPYEDDLLAKAITVLHATYPECRIG